MAPGFKNVGERSRAKNYTTVSLLSVVSKVFEKLVNNRIFDHLEKTWPFIWFPGLFRFSRSTADLVAVVSDRLGRAFNRSGHLIYSRILTWFGMLVFFTYLSLTQFQVGYLALFCLFSLIGGFVWLWMGSLDKNIRLMLVFLKAPFLVLHFSKYTLMTFLMLSVILLSTLMILLSTLSVIRHIACGNN